jgi:hypothetical protein
MSVGRTRFCRRLLVDRARPSAIAVVRLLLSVVGRPAIVRAGATLAAVGLPIAVVFSPSGMRARDLVHAMATSPALRVVLWASWLLLAAPATCAAFDAPGAITLRSLRLPRAPRLAALLALASVVHLPWGVLFARGAGVLEAAGALLVAVAIETAVFAGSRRRRRLLLALPGCVLALWPAPALVALVLGGALAVLGVELAWRTAPERDASAWRLTRPTRPVFALFILFFLRIVRAARSRLPIATLLGSLGGAGLLTLRSDPTPHPVPRALAIMAVPLVVASALFVGPLIECERGIHTLLRSLRVRRLTIVAAFLMALATPATSLAASAGGAASALADVEPLPLVAGLSLWGIALSCLVGIFGRWHDRTRRRSPVAFAAGVAVIASVAVGGMLAW